MKIAGLWDYSNLTSPYQYGEIESYIKAAGWLNECATVEDRGCGCAFARKFFTTNYVGIDGSPSQWTDKVADLLVYKNEVEGILLRHVLEHNEDWRTVLQNALDSFTKRMVIVLHIPPKPEDFFCSPCVFPNGIAIPNIAISEVSFNQLINAFLVKKEVLSKTGEILYYLEKEVK